MLSISRNSVTTNGAARDVSLQGTPMRGHARSALEHARSALGALILLVLLGSTFAGCRSNSPDKGRDTGLACAEDSECASQFCLETRVADELVCCVRRCDDGAVCLVDGSGCEFAPRASSGPDTLAPPSMNPPGTATSTPTGTPSMTSSGADDGAAPGADAGAGGAGQEPDQNMCEQTGSGATDRCSQDASAPGDDAGEPAVDASVSVDDAAAGQTSPATDASAPSPSVADAAAELSPIATTPDTPPAACDTELLANGGFEGGDSVWVTASTWGGAKAIVSAQDSALQQEGVTPQEGNFLGWLGGIPDNQFDSHEISIHQPFNVPADASRVQFKGYVRIASLEPADAEYDAAFVDVIGAGEKVIWIPHIWSNKDVTGDWVAFSYDVTDERLDAMRGKTMLLEIHSETDPEKETSFWFDALSMTAQCGR